jgi:hypothetical protein
VLGSEEVYAGSWLRGYKYSRSKIPSIQMPKHAPIAPRSERPERDGFNYGTDLISRQRGRDVGLCPPLRPTRPPFAQFFNKRMIILLHWTSTNVKNSRPRLTNDGDDLTDAVFFRFRWNPHFPRVLSLITF